MFQILAPQFRQLHPIEASSPQECSEITAHIFASLRFDTTYRIPSYRRWLDGAGHLDAYRFHKRFLQHLQHQHSEAGRWVLKCPDHIFALGALREVYPDANLVFVHRDPVAVLASVARLTEVLRRPFSRRVDRFDVGRGDSDRWLTAAGLMIAAADQERFQRPILHVHYPELVPIRLVRLRRSINISAAFSMRTPQPASADGSRQIPLVGMGGAERDWRIMGSIPAGNTNDMHVIWNGSASFRSRRE